MTFKFRLQKVLSIKEKEEDLSKLEYANSQRKFEVVARKLYESLKKKEELEQQYESKLRKGMNVDTLQRYYHHLQGLHTQIIEEQLAVNKAKFAMEQKQQQIVDKSKEVKKYTILREKQYIQYEMQQRKDENNQLDELSTMKMGERHGV